MATKLHLPEAKWTLYKSTCDDSCNEAEPFSLLDTLLLLCASEKSYNPTSLDALISCC